MPRSNGATHIHVSIITNEKSRLAIEKDLIQQWKPVCNTQFGLIAEEVAEANSDRVVRDETGEICPCATMQSPRCCSASF